MLNTRIFIYGCLTTLLLYTGKDVYAQSGTNKAVAHPNVIIIYSDDQGAADLHCYGSEELVTPNLDKLAANGVRFTQFYAASPICSPSRASLLTGRYPQRAELTGNAGGAKGFGGMPGRQFTLAELFKSAGYNTAHIGKWHMGYTDETMPNAQGFDYSFGFMGGCIDNYSHFYYWGGPNQHDLWRNGTEIWEPGVYFPDLLVRETNNFLQKNKSTPFFLYLAFNTPHYPLQGEVKWMDKYKNLKSPRNMYAACVSTMDEKIGEVMQQLDRLGLTGNTIIVFQGDQGFSKEERAFNGGGSAGTLRGSKFSVLEGGTKVPAIISWPKHIPAHAVRDQFATNIDWFPTLAAYCNIPLPEKKIDGKSLAAVIGSATAPSTHDVFYWQCLGTKDDPQWAVREGNWKLLHSPIEVSDKELAPGKFMLVNLAADSTEHTNEAAAHPDVVERLTSLYQTWIKEVTTQ